MSFRLRSDAKSGMLRGARPLAARRRRRASSWGRPIDLAALWFQQVDRQLTYEYHDAVIDAVGFIR